MDTRVGDDASSPSPVRPFLRVYFKCSGDYLRVYRNAQGTAYLARCPTCGKSMRFLVGPGGTDQRTFEVSCQ
ncbi:MAG: hypothetical protein RBS39_03555 [Phycisphaerales bacterium]|jgi:hypothetical protein|nr:hypothetical protein [Phycisphaerales bacterium]